MKTVSPYTGDAKEERRVLNDILEILQYERNQWSPSPNGYLSSFGIMNRRPYRFPMKSLIKLCEDEEGRPFLKLVTMSYFELEVDSFTQSLMGKISERYHYCYVPESDSDCVCTESTIYDSGACNEKLLEAFDRRHNELLWLTTDLLLFNENGRVINGVMMTETETCECMVEMLCCFSQFKV